MKKSSTLPILVVLFIQFLCFSCQPEKDSLWAVADEPWPEKYGNHRAVLKIDEASDAAELNFTWRRHDPDPDDKKFLIIHSITGDTVANIFRKEINNETCNIVFGPIDQPGQYYFYYLPYAVQEGYGFYYKGHLIPEEDPDTEWVKSNKLSIEQADMDITPAKLMRIEARTSFDSFFPMEVIATEQEKTVFLEKYQKDFYIFPEDRNYPIRMKDNIPNKWIAKELLKSFSGEALQNEYYVYQLGIWAATRKLTELELSFSNLTNRSDTIFASKMTCFNTEGIDPDGNYFTKKLNIEEDQVQALWIGVDISSDQKPGQYKGHVLIRDQSSEEQIFPVTIDVRNKKLEDRGDSELWRHSRLRWLNSTAGLDKNPVAPFEAIQNEGAKVVELTGSSVKLSANGLPDQITVKEDNILSSPVRLEISTLKSDITASLFKLTKLTKYPGELDLEYLCDNKELKVGAKSTIESDGYIRYRYSITAKEDLDLRDIKLLIPFRKEIAQYIMGMGLPGSVVPENHSARWEGPYDSFWIGNPYGGLHCELRGSSYHGPLLNLYKPAPPDSWHNNGKGGFQILSDDHTVYASVNSGNRKMKEGQTLEFEFALLFTPIFELDPAAQFKQRYYHNGGDPAPDDEELEAGVEIINLHHANQYNPHINYPFIATDEMRAFVEKYHDKGKKVKIYYTIRELTNFVTEIWALRSLGDEIIGDGKGGGFPWLREHFINGYTPQWYQRLDSLKADASVLTSTGESRWFNYYVEGLGWLVENMNIDGLYLDDVSFDRRMLKRMRKVMEDRKPGCLIDLHSNTGFSKGPATQYADYFPYVNKLWFGESFQYNSMSPANWLVEVSGIPFGLMGDMLHGGGNPWRGMIYGMTVRYPWTTAGVTCNPRDIWKIWDDFDIASATMLGYWDRNSKIETSNKDVLLTYYQHQDKMLISIASWSEKPESVSIIADWGNLGYDSETRLLAPEIPNFQSESVFSLNDVIPVEPGKGWLLVVNR